MMIGKKQEEHRLPLPAEDYAAGVLRTALVEVVYEWVRVVGTVLCLCL